MGVELYFFQPLGTNSGRVYLTLLEKGVRFSEHELSGPRFEHLEPSYLRINPKGQAPTLSHDGAILTEGAPICEYIDEAFTGPPLRPADAHARWCMRWWCRYIECDLGRSLMMIHWNRIIPQFVGARAYTEVEQIIDRVPDPDRQRAWRSAYRQQTPAEHLQESSRRLRVASQRIEQSLSSDPWIAGSHYSLADIDLLNFYGFVPTWSPELVNESATPCTMDWLRRMGERAAVRELRARSHSRRPQAQ
jgi:GSH-dependent disulfide-bond oxidoreductase